MAENSLYIGRSIEWKRYAQTGKGSFQDEQREGGRGCLTDSPMPGRTGTFSIRGQEVKIV